MSVIHSAVDLTDFCWESLYPFLLWYASLGYDIVLCGFGRPHGQVITPASLMGHIRSRLHLAFTHCPTYDDLRAIVRIDVTEIETAVTNVSFVLHRYAHSTLDIVNALDIDVSRLRMRWTLSSGYTFRLLPGLAEAILNKTMVVVYSYYYLGDTATMRDTREREQIYERRGYVTIHRNYHYYYDHFGAPRNFIIIARGIMH
jgi:hypothetical protein